MFTRLLAVSLMSASIGAYTLDASPTHAMGFCNVDHVSSHAGVQDVRKAAALFYGGAQHLMEMLQAYEWQDAEAGKRAAAGAAGAFRDSADQYRQAAKLFADFDVPGAPDKSRIAELAKTANPGLVERVLTTDVPGWDGDRLAGAILYRCGNSAAVLAELSENFPSTLDDEPRVETFNELLGNFASALRMGTVVSATFQSFEEGD